MSIRYRSNYSLWPEQARPRRAIPMTLAIGGFSIGIVCAVAAHSVVTDFLQPAASPDVANEGVLAHVPIYATAAAPAVASDTEAVTRGRTRSVAKVTLPSIGTRGPLPSAATDGRGGNSNGPASETLGAAISNAAAPVANAPIPTPAPQAVAEIKPDETAAASEPPKVKRKARTRRTARKRRGSNSNYASGYQNNFFGWGGGYGGRQSYARQQYYGRRQYYY
jgi:hypothetical protein